MKKLLILALLLQGICNASIFGMEQEIILTESYSVMPLDDSEHEAGDKRLGSNEFHAFLDGNRLSINADAREPIYVEIISRKSGQVIIAREFVGDTEILIPQSGAYLLQIYDGNTIFTGEFSIE